MGVDALKQLWDLELTWQADGAEMVICVADIQVDVSN